MKDFFKLIATTLRLRMTLRPYRLAARQQQEDEAKTSFPTYGISVSGRGGLSCGLLRDPRRHEVGADVIYDGTLVELILVVVVLGFLG